MTIESTATRRTRQRRDKPQSRFEEALGYLSHIGHDAGRAGARDFWSIGDTISDGHGGQRVLANYCLDCELGLALGANFVSVLQRYPDQARSLLSSTLMAMIRHGRLSGVEVGFIEILTRTLKSVTAPIAVVAAEQRNHFSREPAQVQIREAVIEQPDGTRGIYRTEGGGL
jgi:hypothetical protein